MLKKTVTVLLYSAFMAAMLLLAAASYIFFSLDHITKYFGGGILKYVFIIVYCCVISLPIIYRRKIKESYMLPLLLVLSVISAVVINGIIYKTTEFYVSAYSRQKWDRNENLRMFMIDDLERKYDLTGKTKEEIKEILGEPSDIFDRGEYEIFAYYIGNDLIDAITYEIRFVNDTVQSLDTVHT